MNYSLIGKNFKTNMPLNDVIISKDDGSTKKVNKMLFNIDNISYVEELSPEKISIKTTTGEMLAMNKSLENFSKELNECLLQDEALRGYARRYKSEPPSIY